MKKNLQSFSSANLPHRNSKLVPYLCPVVVAKSEVHWCSQSLLLSQLWIRASESKQVFGQASRSESFIRPCTDLIYWVENQSISTLSKGGVVVSAGDEISTSLISVENAISSSASACSLRTLKLRTALALSSFSCHTLDVVNREDQAIITNLSGWCSEFAQIVEVTLHRRRNNVGECVIRTSRKEVLCYRLSRT